MTDATPGTSIAPRQPTVVSNVQPMLDSAKFEHMQRASKALMHSSILNPSIRGNSPEQCFSNLMLIFDLSDRWKLPAVSIAQGVAIVHDKVVYEGKLITAMLDASLGVRLQYWWTGERGSPDYRIYVSDRPFTELAPDKPPLEAMEIINSALSPGVQIPGWRIVDGSVGDWRTFQKDQRTPNPAWTGAATQNQLSYRGSREWARRYEPAQMLGVYGDDEMEQLTARVVRGPELTATAPGLSAGFTKPAPIEDAIVEEVVEEKTEEKPVEEKPSGKPTEPTQAQDAPKPARGKKAAQAKAAEGQKQEAAPNGPEAGLMPTDEMLKSAYENGYRGTPVLRDDFLCEAGWAAYMAEWNRGAEAGTLAATEKGAAEGNDSADFDGDDDDDSTGNEALDAIREAEPEIVNQVVQDHGQQVDDDPLAALVASIPNLECWADLKAALNATAKTAAWAEAPPERLREIRAAIWNREADIVRSEQERFDFLNDLTAFRCWIDSTDDADAIVGNWQALIHTPLFTSLKPDQQASLERAAKERMEALQAGGS